MFKRIYNYLFNRYYLFYVACALSSETEPSATFTNATYMIKRKCLTENDIDFFIKKAKENYKCDHVVILQTIPLGRARNEQETL